MKKNLPVTNKEILLSKQDSIISITDLKGQITYINETFLSISGFSEDELLGQSHNIVRHPDMPSAAFKDLWSNIKAGKTWQGIVKNRCKNGDHYWVKAFVTPIYSNNKITGYQSIRSKASEKELAQAQILYKV
ncbi:MAG: PAS domain-containing protein [gamma proteobacterium symbiont of Lucinoma myriamae]|nr:PAS domain-containing protein [gamma proteobacterium symbiont of Lucinoma myriamae]